MASIEQTILARFEQRIGTGTGKPDGLWTHRHVERTVDGDTELPLAIVWPRTGDPNHADLSSKLFETLTVMVKLYAGGPGERPNLAALPSDTLIDPLYVWTRSRVLAADAFADLGVVDVRIGQSKWGSASVTDGIVATREIAFEVDFYTTETDPETIG